MQGYVTFGAVRVEKKRRVQAGDILLADYGFNTYSTLIGDRRELIDKSRTWFNVSSTLRSSGCTYYLYGDSTAANAADQKLNPE